MGAETLYRRDTPGARGRQEKAAPVLTLRGGQLDAGTSSALTKMMRVHRWVALTIGLALVLVPRRMDLGLLFPRPLTHSEVVYLKAWGFFVLWLAYVVHHTSSATLEFQKVIAKGLLGMFSGEILLYLNEFFRGDKDELALNAAYIIIFSSLAIGYSFALWKS
ncbi:expressed unknown protein [Seminavis robusta]|uniref:Uncharacterized protein n=1 Tax=Seminavis robusta TaxID=568900 RepID=A0A9N8H759_9STRA|nr:expressed unknown protein [Seminavis robusta]|eukprot:Sro120_g058290.1 n/a (163) ;mRNA; f:11337-11825